MGIATRHEIRPSHEPDLLANPVDFGPVPTELSRYFASYNHPRCEFEAFSR
jgi:hypothetical protein